MTIQISEILQQFIEKQLSYNSRKNLFYAGTENKTEFLDDTFKLVELVKSIPFQEEIKLIDFTVDKVLIEFYKVNQYYRFNTDTQEELKQIYRNLFSTLRNSLDTDLKKVASDHYSRLQQWLQDSNPFSVQLYPENLSAIEEVICAEYSAEIQIMILGLDTSQLLEPILDVGCGIKASLVNYLSEMNLNAHGIDRNVTTTPNLIKTDWMDFSFIPDHWGTIISNLGFSNHFNHQHLRNDGDFASYAQKYMEILQSLKKDGTFYYAPDLPFIEKYLDPMKYQITKQTIFQTNYQSVKIKRMK